MDADSRLTVGPLVSAAMTERNIDLRLLRCDGNYTEQAWSLTWKVFQREAFAAEVKVGGTNSEITLYEFAMDLPVEIGRVRVRMARTACKLGGFRPWFVCPREVCRRRVSVLHWIGRELACRRCLKLPYPSTRESDSERKLKRLEAIRERLGWRPGWLNGRGSKPKWMRWQTFEQIVEKHDRLASELLTNMAKELRSD